MTRVRAPELTGRRWLHTGGRNLSLRDLRGKIVLLDFWTFCCVNCLHVIDELRPLEEKYADVLVVVGVHSPKFAHERDPDAVAAAVERYRVTHPVLDDPDLTTWKQYAVRAWPTLGVVDPEGYLVASMAGEGHAEGLARLVDELIATHTERGTLHRGSAPYVPPPAPETPLRFPGKALALPGTAGQPHTLLVSDTAHHSLVELASDGQTVVRRIGSQLPGRGDGAAEVASFTEPQGLCLLPRQVAATAGYDVVVADTANHLLRGVRLSSGEVVTIAGTGQPARSTVDNRRHDARAVDLSSPWDVAWYAPGGTGRVIVAMAGTHQLWWFDPVTRTAGVHAGTTTESLRDGPLPDVFLAQPSALAADGERLWVVDSETSALRYIEDDTLHTVVGQGLFDFGHADGPAADALFQHPLGVAMLPDGSVAVADTYNGALRRYDPATDSVSTLATGLAEPSDVVVVDGDVVVVESAAHQLVRPVVPGSLPTVDDVRHRSERPATDLAAGEITLEVVYTPPPGQKLDTTFGPPTRLQISASPPELLLAGGGDGTDLTRTLALSSTVDSGVLEVIAQAATCDADIDGVSGAACHLTRQDWGIPIRITPDGATHLPLILRGLAG